jgi:hypothetical protein
VVGTFGSGSVLGFAAVVVVVVVGGAEVVVTRMLVLVEADVDGGGVTAAFEPS